MKPVVTLVTTQAQSADKLSDADYRDIYEELRRKCSLRQFADAIHSAVSFAWWGKYEAGAVALSRERKAELRAAVGLPPLPPTVAEATATADPDATVYQLGEGPANRVVLVGADAHEPLDLRLNGHLSVTQDQEHPVTTVTRPSQRAQRKTVHLTRETWDRLSTARKTANLTWDEFLVSLLSD